MCLCTSVRRNLTPSIRFVYGRLAITDPKDRTMSYYILTLPAFEWVRVDSLDDPLRTQHTCISDGKGQMIITGGFDPTVHGRLRNQNETVDPWPSGFRVYNMSALKYNELYDPSSDAYHASSNVTNVYDSKYIQPRNHEGCVE